MTTTTVYFPITLSESAVAVWTPEASQTVPAGSTYPGSFPTSCPVLIDGSKSPVIGTAVSPTVVADTTFAASQPVSMTISYRCEYNVTEVMSTTATKVLESSTNVTSKNTTAALLGYYFMRRRTACRIRERIQQENCRLREEKIIPGERVAFTHRMKGFLLQGAHFCWGDIQKDFKPLDVGFWEFVRLGLDCQKVLPNSVSLNKSLETLGLSEDARNLICELLTEPRTRRIAMRHVLVWAVFSNLDIRSVGPLSLLHPAIKNFMLYDPKEHRKREEYTDPMERDEIVRNAWRQVSAALLQESILAWGNHHLYSRTNPHLDSQIQSLMDALSGFLEHLPMLDDGPFKHGWIPPLRRLIFRCAKLCYILASDPGNWVITLPPPSLAQGVCIFPGLTLVRDHDRDPLREPRVFIFPKWVKVDHADKSNNAEAQNNMQRDSFDEWRD
ncbi:hypothetical protein MAC_06824 [Metarhizium acridum CQMa 102]|uniref:Uncharacterized protein n=1 Tax=Metarhizium acridum (strain CQMa 102) TaxID=655827 RepID=E9EAC5_METAQ|nr:uncharacterized protein MAC_06824 [Metarhizium acridum CQMa 102]EFY87146.1 hypothetical protein MAC_06824 [Metarhizium acridum CQMa 102]